MKEAAHRFKSEGQAIPEHSLRDWGQALDAGLVAVLVGPAPLELPEARAVCRGLAAALRRAAGGFVYESRSVTAGAVAIAMCRSRPVGVDVEALRSGWVDADVLDVALHPDELATLPADREVSFFDLWTRKEALLKSLGAGLALPPRSIHAGWERGWSAVPAAGMVSHVRNLSGPPGIMTALAALGARPSIQHWRWDAATESFGAGGPAPSGAQRAPSVRTAVRAGWDRWRSLVATKSLASLASNPPLRTAVSTDR